jgi:hypothetical protein
MPFIDGYARWALSEISLIPPSFVNEAQGFETLRKNSFEFDLRADRASSTTNQEDDIRSLYWRHALP